MHKEEGSLYLELVKKSILKELYPLTLEFTPEETNHSKLKFSPIKRGDYYPVLSIPALTPKIPASKTWAKENIPVMQAMLEYMDKMIDSMLDTEKELKKSVKAKYHNMLNNSKFQMFDSSRITSKEQFLTEYLPIRIACVFCYTFEYEEYDEKTFSYVSDYVEKEYQKIKPEAENLETASEMIAFLSNHCIEHDIFIACKKASVQMKIDKKRMQVDFQYLTTLVFNSMYKKSKNDYDKDVILPSYSKEIFQNEAKKLLPRDFFLENKKSVRPNTICKKLKESDLEYVENEIRKAQYITFSKLSEELEQFLNSDTEDEYVVKETILNRISILMELVGYRERTIPKSMQDEFYKVYQLFSKDFLLRIKKYNEQGCIDYLADKSNNEILQIINKDSEAEAVFELCRMIKVICLIESTSTQDYQNRINSMNINKKHLRVICDYCKGLSA